MKPKLKWGNGASVLAGGLELLTHGRGTRWWWTVELADPIGNMTVPVTEGPPGDGAVLRTRNEARLAAEAAAVDFARNILKGFGEAP